MAAALLPELVDPAYLEDEGPSLRLAPRPQRATPRFAPGLVKLLAAALFLLGLCWLHGPLDGDPAAATGTGPAAEIPSSYVVQPGDTLWSIASSWDLRGDLRTVVRDLAEANGGDQLQPGQRLVVPDGIG